MTNRQKIAGFLRWLENKKWIELVEMMNEYGEEGNIKRTYDTDEVMELYEEYLEDMAGFNV